jgi:hypothetical protein
MREELYEDILEVLYDNLGYKCQPSELEELAEQVVDKLLEFYVEELG